MNAKHVFFRRHVGFNKTRYKVIYYRANLGDWNKGSIEYKCPYSSESAFWILERWIESWTWQRRYVSKNPWPLKFFCENPGLPAPVNRR